MNSFGYPASGRCIHFSRFSARPGPRKKKKIAYRARIEHRYYALMELHELFPHQSQDRYGKLLTEHGKSQELVPAIFAKQHTIVQLIKNSRKKERKKDGQNKHLLTRKLIRIMRTSPRGTEVVVFVIGRNFQFFLVFFVIP